METKMTHWEKPWGILCLSKVRVDLLSSVSISTGTHWWKTLNGCPPLISQNQSSEAATERKEKMERDCCSVWQWVNSHLWINPPALSRWVDILFSSAQSPWIVWDSCQSVMYKCQSCPQKSGFVSMVQKAPEQQLCPWMPSSSKCTEEHSVTTFIVQPVYLHFICTIQLWSALEFLRQVILKNFSSFL